MRTIFDIRNAKDASAFIMNSFDKRTPITEKFLCDLQYTLTKNTYDQRRWQVGERPGTYKKHDYVTGRYEVGCAPEEVSQEISELLSEITDLPNAQVFTAAAYFHARFENIHPFADGNGRTGRLAMNYFLLLHNHPPIVIYEDDKKLYYQTSEAYDVQESLELLKLFLKMELERTWNHPRFLRHA